MLFVELSYTLATEEAERIGVDHVARVSTSETLENSTGKKISILSLVYLEHSEATMLIVELSYTLATEEAERIGVDHVARVSTSETLENSTGKKISQILSR